MMPVSIWQMLWRTIWPRRYVAPAEHLRVARDARDESRRKLKQTEKQVAEVMDEFGRRVNAAWRRDLP